MSKGVPPYTPYDQNVYNNMHSPVGVHFSNNATSCFFRKYFAQRAMSVFKWRLPENWSENFFLEVLYYSGFVAIINTDKFGVIPQNCGLSGYNVFYQPTTAIIANPLIRQTMECRIGVNCEIIRLQPDYSGITDIITYYADLMALALQALDANLINSKLSFVFAAKNPAMAEGLKKMYDRIMRGEPAVVIDKQLFNDDGKPSWLMFNQDLASNHIAPKLLEELRYIQNMFDTEIGIPNANTSKRERLIQSEVSANNVETVSKCELWLDSLKKSCKLVNQMFGTSLSVDWRFPPMEVMTDDRNAGLAGNVSV